MLPAVTAVPQDDLHGGPTPAGLGWGGRDGWPRPGRVRMSLQLSAPKLLRRPGQPAPPCNCRCAGQLVGGIGADDGLTTNCAIVSELLKKARGRRLTRGMQAWCCSRRLQRTGVSATGLLLMNRRLLEQARLRCPPCPLHPLAGRSGSTRRKSSAKRSTPSPCACGTSTVPAWRWRGRPASRGPPTCAQCECTGGVCGRFWWLGERQRGGWAGGQGASSTQAAPVLTGPLPVLLLRPPPARCGSCWTRGWSRWAWSASTPPAASSTATPPSRPC